MTTVVKDGRRRSWKEQKRNGKDIMRLKTKELAYLGSLHENTHHC